MEKCIACNSVLKPFLKCNCDNLFHCARCGLAVLEDKPDSKKAVNFYQKFYDEQESERFQPLFESIVVFFRKSRVELIESFAKNKGKILDVGFGRPIDLEAFQQNGWSAYGTQIVPHVVKVAKQRKLNAFLGELQNAHYSSNKFDAITMWHVLEHLNKPQLYLKEAHRILKKGGTLILEVPNIDSIVAKTFGCNWFEMDVPHHVYQFTPKSLTLLLERNGFQIEKKTFFSLEQSPFSILQSFLNLFSKRRNILFDALKKTHSVSFIIKLLNVLIAILLSPIAILLSVLFAVVGKGDVMRFHCIKK